MDQSRVYWTCGGVTAASASVSAGFSAVAVWGGGFGDVTALYAASRILSLVSVALRASVRVVRKSVKTVLKPCKMAYILEAQEVPV